MKTAKTYLAVAGAPSVEVNQATTVVYGTGVTDVLGTVVLYLTKDGTITGEKIFDKIFSVLSIGAQNVGAGVASASITYRPITDNKTLILDATKGAVLAVGGATQVPAAGVLIEVKVTGA